MPPLPLNLKPRALGPGSTNNKNASISVSLTPSTYFRRHHPGPPVANVRSRHINAHIYKLLCCATPRCCNPPFLSSMLAHSKLSLSRRDGGPEGRPTKKSPHLAPLGELRRQAGRVQKRMEPTPISRWRLVVMVRPLQAKGLGDIGAPKRRAPFFNPGANESPDHASDRSGPVGGVLLQSTWCAPLSHPFAWLGSSQFGRWERGHARPGLHCLCETAWR